MTQIRNLEQARLVYPFVATTPASLARSESADGVALRPVRERETDRVELSAAGTQLAEAARAERKALRTAKVARIRAEIENGTYDVNGKLAAVIDRVMADVLR